MVAYLWRAERAEFCGQHTAAATQAGPNKAAAQHNMGQESSHPPRNCFGVIRAIFAASRSPEWLFYDIVKQWHCALVGMDR